MRLETWLRSVAARAAEEAGQIKDERLERALFDLAGRADGLAEAVEGRRKTREEQS